MFFDPCVVRSNIIMNYLRYWIKFIKEPGMKKGETLLGPFSYICMAVFAIDPRPQIPEPIITPVLFLS